MFSRDEILSFVKSANNNQKLQDIKQRAWVEISLAALAHNVIEIKKILADSTKLMAVVKADAYGHGSIKVAQTVLKAGCHSLAVATLGEGIILRQAGIRAKILILGAINSPSEIIALTEWQLEPTLCNPQQAFIFAETLEQISQKLPVHLKIDTGMSRLGTSWQQATEFISLVSQLPYLEIASVYSHLATADELDTSMMKLQHQRFQSVINQIKKLGIVPSCLHLANSAGTLSDRNLHYDLVRVGLALYGLYPAPHFESVVNLKPAMQVKAKITQVKTIPAGCGVSYGHKFVSNKETRIAVVGIGYADGIPRNLSNRLQVLVRGELLPQIGAITMDQLMLDVSKIPDLQPGEIVTLIGKDGNKSISADDWANIIDTISWEILCSFKNRLPRITD